MDGCCCDRDDLDKISKGWSIAMFYSKERLRRVYELDDAQLGKAVEDGKLVLETLCLFVHACIKRGQYRYVYIMKTKKQDNEEEKLTCGGGSSGNKQTALGVLACFACRVWDCGVPLGADRGH